MRLINSSVEYFYTRTRATAISKKLYSKAGIRLYHKISNDLFDIEAILTETLNI